MNIYLNDFRQQWMAIKSDAIDAFEQFASNGWYILGDKVQSFEDRLASFWGLPFCVGVGNGLDAIEIGLRCLGLQPGDRVLTTPLSAFATTLAILRCGGVPVFVDVDRSGLLDLDRCRRLLERDPSIRFMVPVHLYGRSMDLDELKSLRDRFSLHIVEDCAQSVGARWHGRVAGCIGQVAATSFYPTKNLGTLGDGGALLSSDPQIADRARALRNYGQTATYVHDHLGLNSRLDELHAALLGDVMLPRLDGWNQRRGEIADHYRKRITNPALELPAVPPDSDPVWHLFPILTPAGARDRFRAFLSDRQIQTGVHYPVLIPDQRALEGCPDARIAGDLAVAKNFAENEVSLPIHPFLSDVAVDAVIDASNLWQP